MSVTAVGHHSEVPPKRSTSRPVARHIGVVIRNAVDDRTTEADTTASATLGAALSTTGAVTVSARATNHVTAQAYTGFPEIKIAGLAISVLYSLAEVGRRNARQTRRQRLALELDHRDRLWR